MKDMQALGTRSGEVTILDTLQDQFGSTPWWLVSLLSHILALLLAMATIVWKQPVEKITEHYVSIVAERPQQPHEPKKITDPVRTIDPVVDVSRIVVDDPPTDELDEEMDDMQVTRPHGDPTAVSTGHLAGFQLSTDAFGIGGGPKGTWGSRLSPSTKKRLIGVYAPPETLSKTDRGLLWLALHQEPDGRWDGEKYEGEDADAGLTGLALLAFLGAGHTETAGKYRNTVRKAVAWIISQQAEDGCIGRNSSKGGLGYHHAICGLALAEAYGMARRRLTGIAAQKAVDYSINIHQVPYSGWRYNPRQEPDTSVTGWFVMQLKSAKMAGLKVPDEGLCGAANWLDEVTDTGNYLGRVGYRSPEEFNHALTAVGLTCRLFLGWKPDDPIVRGGAEYLLSRLPSWGPDGNGVNFYYWYYGAMAMYQMGGRYWRLWNDAMVKAIWPHQREGGDEDGSWDPAGKWCSRGGRVYSTAMAVLCTEVYYRQMPLFR